MKVKDAAMQAFPFIEPTRDDAVKAYHPGMTLRDMFAMVAMHALIVTAERRSADSVRVTSAIPASERTHRVAV